VPTTAGHSHTLMVSFLWLRAAEHDYLLEGGSLAFAALYLANYFLGRSQNKKIADKWSVPYGSRLRCSVSRY
jgi:hypothetical protein